MTNEILTAKDVAKQLKLTPRTLRVYLRKINGKAPGVKYEWRPDDAFLKKLETSKNGKPRVAPMADTVYALLKRCAEGKGQDDYLFTRTNGRPVREFRNTWRKLCDAAGVKILVHDLRRTAARNLRRAGVSEGVIMKMGGWVTRSMFERYNIIDTRDMREALAKLDEHKSCHNPTSPTESAYARPN